MEPNKEHLPLPFVLFLPEKSAVDSHRVICEKLWWKYYNY